MRANDKTALVLVLDVQLWQSSHNLDRFNAYRDHTAKKIKGVAGIADGFGGVAVGIVYYAAGRVFLNSLPLHHPLNRRLAVDHVVIGFFGYVFDGNVAVLDDAGAVFALARTCKTHLGDAEERLGIGDGGKA